MSDGVIVGSALLSMIAKAGPAGEIEAARSFVAGLKRAISANELKKAGVS